MITDSDAVALTILAARGRDLFFFPDCPARRRLVNKPESTHRPIRHVTPPFDHANKIRYAAILRQFGKS
jgi:hypothetical protein